MDCRDLTQLLDAFQDRELSAEDEKALRAHAAGCETCARELKAAEALRELSDAFIENNTPTLPAQQAWKKAIRREAALQRKRVIYRWAGAAAAACILTVGVFGYLNTRSAGRPVATDAYRVQTDGVSEQDTAFYTGAPDSAEAVRVTVVVADLTRASSALSDVLAEYGAEETAAATEANAKRINITVPEENAQELIAALDGIGSVSAPIEAPGSALCIELIQE